MRPYLVSFARKLGASFDDAQDLAQQALCKALVHIRDFRGGDDQELKFWLGTILRNCYFDSCRRARKASALAHMAFEGESCDGRGEAVCQTADALRRLKCLNEGQRAVVCELLLGLDYEEIAEALDIPLGTVKSRISRAREVLSAP